MVFQHFSVFEALTVAENIALALPPEPLGRLSARIAEVSRTYGLAIDPGRAVHTLSVGEKQRVEIIRCLLQDPKLLIMDEPTSVLTPQEAEALFATLDRLAAEGRAILYISHRLEEVRALCDRATILRQGEVVADCDPRAETARALAETDGRQRDRRGRAAASARRRARSACASTGSTCRRHPSSPSRCATSRSRCAAARWSASPASPARARPS